MFGLNISHLVNVIHSGVVIISRKYAQLLILPNWPRLQKTKYNIECSIMSREQVEKGIESYKNKVEMGFALFKNSVVFQTTFRKAPENLEKNQIPQQPEQPKKSTKGLK